MKGDVFFFFFRRGGETIMQGAASQTDHTLAWALYHSQVLAQLSSNPLTSSLA